MGASPIGLTAATPTRGEILVQLGALSRKPRSAKRKKSSSTEKDRTVPAKVQKLGASPTSFAREPEWAPSPAAEAPLVLSSQPPSKPDAEAKKSLGCGRRAAAGGYAYNRLESTFGECQVTSSKGGRAEEKEIETKS